MATSSQPGFSPTQSLSPHDPPSEIKPLVYACITGQLDQVKEIFQGYLTRQDYTEDALYEFWPVLLTAIEYDKPEIVRYLLCLGIPLEPMHIQKAIETKSTSIFDVLINHNWDINQSLGDFKPPALA